MANQVFPTKGNLIATKKSLELAYLGYDLMDKKKKCSHQGNDEFIR